MSNIKKKKKKKKSQLSLREKFRKSQFRRYLSDFITLIENTMHLDRKRSKLLIMLIVLIIVFFFDIIWLVLPHNVRHPVAKPEFTKEEIPALIVKNQLALEQNPRDFQAHYELGKIYFFSKESEKAKVEFFQAMEYAPEGNYKAHFAFCNMYIKYYKEPEMAAQIMADVDDRQLSKELLLQKADNLYAISKLFFGKNNFQGAYAALNEAYNDYGNLGEKEKLEKAKTDMVFLLIDMADESYYVEKNPTKAMVYIENSQQLQENAWAYAKLGYLFFENPKISADYFEKAYSFNPKAVNLEIFIPTLVDAIRISIEENRMADKSYYKGVLERVREENLISKIHTKLRANNLKAFYEKNDDKDEYLPVAYLDICNGLERNNIHYLKVRAVFVDVNGRIVGHHDVIPINSSKPLKPEETCRNIRIDSNRFVTGQQRKDNIYKVVIYFSKNRPDEWAYVDTKMLQ